MHLTSIEEVCRQIHPRMRGLYLSLCHTLHTYVANMIVSRTTVPGTEYSRVVQSPEEGEMIYPCCCPARSHSGLLLGTEIRHDSCSGRHLKRKGLVAEAPLGLLAVFAGQQVCDPKTIASQSFGFA